MDQGSLLDHFAQVRRQVVTLCSSNRFSAAQMLLVGSGLSVGDAPGLWEHIARRAAQAGHDPIAHELRKLIWNAGGRSDALALQEAAFFLKQGDYTNCAFVIEGQFGPTPENLLALEYLTRAYMVQAQAHQAAGRLKTDRATAIRLTEARQPQTATHAMAAVDLLRFSGEFDRALALNTQAKNSFPDDIRFVMREARMVEQKAQYDQAITLWKQVAAQSERYRADALLRLFGLQDRLEKRDDAQTTAAQLLVEPIPIEQRLGIALSLGHSDLVQAIARLIADGGPSGAPISFEQGKAIGNALLDHGEIGLLVWLRRQRMPLSDRVKSVLDACAFGEAGGPAMPDSFQAASQIKSPDFMIPLDDFAARAPKPPGWPGPRETPGRILLVNASLKAGGAERQFVTLIKALLESGVPKSDIHVALYSLEADRGMDRFLPDLRALDVTIHDLNHLEISNPSLPSDVARVFNALPFDLREDLQPLWHLVTALKPNVIHGWQDRAAIACGLVGYLTETERMVLSMRNMSPLSRHDRRLQRHKAILNAFMTRDNVTLTANSDVGAADYAAWLDVPKQQVKPLRNIVDVKRFTPIVSPREADGPLRIGGVFRLALNKRPLLWLQTVAALRNKLDRPIKPVIFGDGPMADQVAAEATDLGLDDLKIISNVTDPAEIYRHMDVMLLMSRVEGLPNVMLEAQAAGLPVAACEVGGVREAAQKRGDAQALLLPAEVDPQTAANLLAGWIPTACAASPDPRIGFVRTHFGPEVTVAAVKNLYCGGKDGSDA